MRLLKWILCFVAFGFFYLCVFGLQSKAMANGYGIVTTSEIRAASTMLSTFESHKASRGFNVQVFDETDWGGMNLTGDPAAEALREFLKVAHAQYNLEYLLIVGDPRDNSGPIPMKTLYPRIPGDAGMPLAAAVPSDYYYADTTGNWDLDGDTDYGEFGSITGDFGPGGIDRNHEMLVGRIPVYGTSNNQSQFNQSVQALDHILTKTIDYQNEADISWRYTTLIAAEGANRLFYGEQIKDALLQPNGISDYRVYDSVGISLLDPPDADTTSVPNVKAGWDATNPGIVTWLTHGGGTGAAAVMDTSTAATLNDNFPVMTWQASCFNSQPSNPNNLSYELLINGAIATVGFTEISHGPGSAVDLTSDAHVSGIAGLGYGYIKRIAIDQLTVGQALMELKRDSTLYNRSWYWQNHVGANLYGDPEVSLYENTGSANTLFAVWMAARGQTDPLATMPGAVVTNLQNYAFGVDLASNNPNVTQAILGTTTFEAQQYRTISYRLRLGNPLLVDEIEWSQDLTTWTPAATSLTLVSETPNGDGTKLITFRINAPLNTEPKAFLRVRISLP